MAVAGEQSHALAVTLNDQAVAIVLDFVNPVGTAGHLASPSRNAGLKGSAAHLMQFCRATSALSQGL